MGLDGRHGVHVESGAEVAQLGPVTREGFGLVVPADEEQAARMRGARFDRLLGRWYVPSGVEVHLHNFRRWLPDEICCDEGATVPASVLAIEERCYRCGTRTTAIVGVLVPAAFCLDPDGFVEFADVSEYLAEILDTGALAVLGIGELRWRRSRAVPHGYVANGCVQCSTILGNHPLTESLTEHLSLGRGYESLDSGLRVAIPASMLDAAFNVRTRTPEL